MICRPQRLHNFTLTSVLNDGLEAWVFLAQDDKGRSVVVKRFCKQAKSNYRGDSSSDDLKQAKRKQEIANATQIAFNFASCRYIARFQELLDDPGDDVFAESFALVFEYCEVGSLVDFIDTRTRTEFLRVTRFELLTAALHLTCALDTMHQRFAHRDIAPRNVFVAKENKQLVFKLGDVGESKYVHPQGEVRGIKSSAHVAPELFDQTAGTVASDVFALGLVLLELASLTLRSPGSMRPEDVAKDQQQARTLLESKELMDLYGADVLTAIARMMAEAPTGRYTAHLAFLRFKELASIGAFNTVFCSHGFCCSS